MEQLKAELQEQRRLAVEHKGAGRKTEALEALKRCDHLTLQIEALGGGKVDGPTSPSAWRSAKTAEGHIYYFNKVTRETSWVRPEGFTEVSTKAPVESGYSLADRDRLLAEAEKEAAEKLATAAAAGGGTSTDEVEITVQEDKEEEEEEEEVLVDPRVKKKKRDSAVWNLRRTASSSSMVKSTPTSPKTKEKEEEFAGHASVWIMQSAASSGMEEGEVYYLNTVTGETSWERPEDYDGGEDYKGLDFDPSDSLASVLAMIDIGGARSIEARDAMLLGGEGDEEDTLLRLSTFLRALEACGTEEEWEVVISEDDMSLPLAIFSYWGRASAVEVNLVVAQILLLFGKLNPNVYASLADGKWGTFDKLLVVAEEGLKMCLDHNDEDGSRVWMSLLYSILTEESIFENGIGMEHMPSKKFVALVFSTLGYAEDVADCGACLLVCLNVHYDSNEESEVIKVCLEDPDLAEPFSIALIRILNQQAFPYGDRLKLQCTIKFCRDLFFDPDTATFFYSTDLNVLVDVILRECGSLPMEDDIRVLYLETLRYLLGNSQWYEQGRYRRDLILETLKALMEGRAGTVLDESFDMCEAILLECIAVLE